MATLHAEFTVGDYEQWKAMFDSDPAGRQAGGVGSYRISRGVKNPNHVMLDLQFDDSSKAEAFLEALGPVWASAPAGAIQNAIGVVVETTEETQL
jgi:ribosomal protein L35AE/L33A